MSAAIIIIINATIIITIFAILIIAIIIAEAELYKLIELID